jgi:hypothetical protein
MQNDSDMRVPFDDLVDELRAVAPPGRVTVVSYSGLKFARECGIGCWEFAATISFQNVIHDHGTPRSSSVFET